MGRWLFGYNCSISSYLLGVGALLIALCEIALNLFSYSLWIQKITYGCFPRAPIVSTKNFPTCSLGKLPVSFLMNSCCYTCSLFPAWSPHCIKTGQFIFLHTALVRIKQIDSEFFRDANCAHWTIWLFRIDLIKALLSRSILNNIRMPFLQLVILSYFVAVFPGNEQHTKAFPVFFI